MEFNFTLYAKIDEGKIIFLASIHSNLLKNKKTLIASYQSRSFNMYKDKYSNTNETPLKF